jgi:hypothetical protein
MTQPTREYAARSQIKRVIDAARDAGIEIGGVEVTVDGTIRVLALNQVQRAPMSEFDRWQDKL